jgi:hypothetical protein
MTSCCSLEVRDPGHPERGGFRHPFSTVILRPAERDTETIKITNAFI